MADNNNPDDALKAALNRASREADAEALETERLQHSANLAAFARAQKDEEGVEIAGEKKDASAIAPQGLQNLLDAGTAAKLSPTGRKIDCGNGLVIYDRGDHYFIPGKPTGEQLSMVAKLAAQEKGWDKIYLYKAGTNQMHTEATQVMMQIAAGMAGISCHTDQGSMPSQSSMRQMGFAHFQNFCRAIQQSQAAPAEPALV